MVNLINAKYDNILEKFIGKVSNDPKNIEEAIRWIGKIGMALEEFSHILKEYQALAEARRNGEQNAMMNYVYEAPSVFKLTISLVESLIPSSKTSEIRFAKAEKGIEYLEDILEAYELYSNKNYAGGTIKVVEIASKLFSIDSTFIVKLEKGDKSKYQPYTTEFKRLKLPISELVKTQKDSIQKFLGSLNLESTKDTASLTKLIPKSFEKEIRKIIKDKPQLDKSIQTALNNLMTQKKDSLETFLGKLDSILIIDTASLNKYIPKYLSEKNYPLFKNLREELQIMDTFKINLKPALNNVAALNEVTRLASFLNDVALSTDSKGLSKVIESYAMPPGSYKKKRNSWMSVDLNAYVGAYTGIEKIRDIDLDKKVIGTYGVTAPIGLTLSWNRRKEITDNSIKLSDTYLEEYKFTDEGILKKRKPVTFYIHTTIVDLGAIVAFKIGNPVVDSTDLEMQKFRWEQFFSPGLTFGIGIPKTPLVASVGYQFAPQIRKLSLETEQFDAHRFSIGILVDIPLFNIWMKRYSKLPKDNK
jgi:hypothetical protein